MRTNVYALVLGSKQSAESGLGISVAESQPSAVAASATPVEIERPIWGAESKVVSIELGVGPVRRKGVNLCNSVERFRVEGLGRALSNGRDLGSIAVP